MRGNGVEGGMVEKRKWGGEEDKGKPCSLSKAEPNKATGVSQKAYSHHTCCHCYLFIAHLHFIFCELPVHILLKLTFKKKMSFYKSSLYSTDTNAFSVKCIVNIFPFW